MRNRSLASFGDQFSVDPITSQKKKVDHLSATMTSDITCVLAYTYAEEREVGQSPKHKAMSR